MPWIQVCLAPTAEQPAALAHVVAGAAASALELRPDEVIVLVTPALAWSGPGAVVTVTGRDRGEPYESALVAGLRETVAAAAGLDADLVAVVRQPAG